MRTVGARRTKVLEVTTAVALEFVAEHHRQGIARPGANQQSYGLFLHDELLAIAIFCNPRTNAMARQYTTELFRLAFKEGVRIPGGASKLIKHFLSTEPWDLFTYQSLAGEVTDVYLHAGLNFVSEEKIKTILVKDGLSHDTAQDNRRDWFSLEQVTRYGPDKLLKTNLGEVFRADGVRKTNIELFIEHCGYHEEKVPGDRIYEWRNPKVGFYTYRITSSKAPGYYFGRRTLRSANATQEEALADLYMGSGGKKFKAWVETVGLESLSKEIMGVFSTWPEVIEAERKLIANNHLDDADCMNTQPGGLGLGKSISYITLQECPIHGTSKFNGKKCMRCYFSKAWSLGNCTIHGESYFRKGVCEACKQATRWSEGLCKLHGSVKLVDGNCIKCKNNAILSLRSCELHGIVTHFGKTCATCTSQKSVNLKECSLHGLTKHQGKVCNRCNALKAFHEKVCADDPTHGVTTHQGATCLKCATAAQLSKKECPSHGLTMHKGDTCAKCTVDKARNFRQCKENIEHGVTLHQGDVCSTCNSQKSVVTKQCLTVPAHGITKHQGSVCSKCNAQASVEHNYCAVHEAVMKYQGGKCVACRNAALITMKRCPTHGETKHRGKTCYSCMGERRRQKKLQKEQASA